MKIKIEIENLEYKHGDVIVVKDEDNVFTYAMFLDMEQFGCRDDYFMDLESGFMYATGGFSACFDEIFAGEVVEVIPFSKLEISRRTKDEDNI